MKYRIKKVYYADGAIYFYPQYKKYLRWKYFFNKDGFFRYSFTDYRDAEEYINTEISINKAQKVVQVSYIKINPNNV